jgi:hypothetical protein
VWLWDRLLTIQWVGWTDLEIELLVADTTTGQPVEAATIEVHSEGGFYEEREPQRFTLVTDREGVAKRVCRRSMCCGTQSGLKFTDTYVVHLPRWRFRVSAPDCQASKWIDLDVPEYIRQVQRVGPGAAKLVVRVPLQKATAQASAASGRGLLSEVPATGGCEGGLLFHPQDGRL